MSAERESSRPKRRRRGGRGRGRNRNSRPLARDLDAARTVAKQRFGIPKLREEQAEAIDAVLEGNHSIVVLPTGYGKSLIYQLPAILTDQPTIVISPLIALMADQERSLKRHGVPVVRLDSSVTTTERREALRRIEAGGSLIILTTPETLDSDATRPVFEAAEPWLLCIDEAHCISEWGHDFRPTYLQIGAARAALGDPVVLALTATATPRVREDIARRLGLTDPVEITAPPHRKNLRLTVTHVSRGSKPAFLGKMIRRLRRPGIVYCATTVDAERIWATLSKARIPCARYHGRMKKADREAAQQRFMHPKKSIVMVATSAFGMGIDKSNIRYIVHYQVPGSLEQYVQEAGRAGRDGKPSQCILLYDPEDLSIQKHLQSTGRSTIRHLESLTKTMVEWAKEQRPVSVDDLAFTASIPKTTCRTLCADLEELGVLDKDEDRNYVAAVPLRELEQRARLLAGRMETKRREDEQRLLDIADYASSLECHSVYLRRYFGEDDPPACGHCDRCKALGIKSGEPQPPRRRRPRRRRKRGGSKQ